MVQKVIEGGFYKSGNQLIENCDDESVYGRTACLNYILGIAEAHTTLKAWGEANVMCIPETVTGGQLMAVSLKYMRSVSEILHLGAGSHVLNALPMRLRGAASALRSAVWWTGRPRREGLLRASVETQARLGACVAQARH